MNKHYVLTSLVEVTVVDQFRTPFHLDIPTLNSLPLLLNVLMDPSLLESVLHGRIGPLYRTPLMLRELVAIFRVVRARSSSTKMTQTTALDC